jgi:hypothetical protein
VTRQEKAAAKRARRAARNERHPGAFSALREDHRAERRRQDEDARRLARAQARGRRVEQRVLAALGLLAGGAP